MEEDRAGARFAVASWVPCGSPRMNRVPHPLLLVLRRQVLLRALCCFLALLTLPPVENPVLVVLQSLLYPAEAAEAEDNEEVESPAKAVLSSSSRCCRQRAHQHSHSRAIAPTPPRAPRPLFANHRAVHPARALRSGAGSRQRC
jgi:hypothetical protein